MTMRITTVTDPAAGRRLVVEGNLTDDNVAELRSSCETFAAAGMSTLCLDLRGLRFADAGGTALLLDIERAGARLDGASPFLTELLRGAPMDTDPDGDLLSRLQAGDEAAFEELVRTYGGRMLAAARRMFSDEDDARDAVQEAFLAAVRSIHTFKGGARLSTWLHRVVVNASLMKLRSRRRRREESIDDLLPRFDESGRFAEPGSGWETECSSLYECAETRAKVRRAIAKLPERYRTVIILRDIEELDTEETADRLGINANAVKTRLHRARLALKTLLAGELTGAGETTASPRPISARLGARA